MPDKSDRLRLLGQWVPERGLLRIEEAARLLECSSMTVRRDVASAPERFVLLGGHIVAAGAGRLYDLNRELTVNVQAKEAVCANAIARLTTAIRFSSTAERRRRRWRTACQRTSA